MVYFSPVTLFVSWDCTSNCLTLYFVSMVSLYYVLESYLLGVQTHRLFHAENSVSNYIETR